MPRKIPSTKIELVRALSAKADISQTKVELVLDALAGFAYAGAPARRGFSIPGIGRICVIERKARRGFNPKTGRVVEIPAKAALSFRFSDFAKAAILPALAKPEEKKEKKSKKEKKAPAKPAARKPKARARAARTQA